MSTEHVLFEGPGDFNYDRDGQGAGSGECSVTLTEHSTLHDLEIATDDGAQHVSVKDLSRDDMVRIALRILAVANYTHPGEIKPIVEKFLVEHMDWSLT